VTAFSHAPVLLEPTLALLALAPGMTAVDCTVGGGGHARRILEAILPGGRLIGIDQDQRALAAAEDALRPVGAGHYRLVYSNFARLRAILRENDCPPPQAILLDLGVSAYQLTEGGRGFSYQQEGPLDMRMDPGRQEITAAALVNQGTERDLAGIFWRYGEERWSERIAQFIGAERKKAPIETTSQLTTVIKKAIPAGARATGHHPAKRVFQALRIAVNGEVELLEQALRDAAAALAVDGRLAVITFHSLEDRIVKKTFQSLATGCICPKDLPACVCGRRPVGRILTPKPIVPDEAETRANPRSRSGKLRGFRKTAGENQDGR
jgi:16S rRNA (cytosine1402-N4)-methyltransferase